MLRKWGVYHHYRNIGGDLYFLLRWWLFLFVLVETINWANSETFGEYETFTNTNIYRRDFKILEFWFNQDSEYIDTLKKAYS